MCVIDMCASPRSPPPVDCLLEVVNIFYFLLSFVFFKSNAVVSGRAEHLAFKDALSPFMCKCIEDQALGIVYSSLSLSLSLH